MNKKQKLTVVSVANNPGSNEQFRFNTQVKTAPYLVSESNSFLKRALRDETLEV